LTFFQDNLLDSSTASLTLRAVCLPGPTIENRKVLCRGDPMPKLAFPKRHKHADVRSREYLTTAEVDRLRQAARRVGRHGLRNDTMILLAYRHGLRVSELIAFRWEQFDLDQRFFRVRCLTHGVPSTHP
jgi:site-specific recombinase XerD